jgi:hypothetical protein
LRLRSAPSLHPFRIFISSLLFLAGNSALARSSGAQEKNAPRTLTAHRVKGPVPVIDGRLDDEVWKMAAVATDFVQNEPDGGSPATQRTTASFIYDGGSIYVAMRMYDTHPDSIRAPLSRRDDDRAPAEWAMVSIDSNHDRRTAYRFQTTPRGMQADALFYDDTRDDQNWDAVWEVATQIDSLGWTAEFRIPLSQLRYSIPTDGTPIVWGIEFSRELSRRSETSHWSPIPPGSGRFVSMFGDLRGLEELTVSRRFEVMPYTLGRLTREPGDSRNPFYSSNQTKLSVGADLKMGLTPSLTLSATIDPDFGQVEADPSIVNLGTFETFYPERRPFFTEGANIFRFNMSPEAQLFYSRRIGRAPQRSVNTPDGGFIHAPETSRILGAAKISGKTASGWSLGLMHAVTGAANAKIADSMGLITEEPIEPLTQYSAARVVRDFREGESGIGAMATSVFRKIDDERFNFLRDRAITTGVNGWYRFASNKWETRASMVGSFLHGSPLAIAATQRNGVHRFQRPDGHVTYDTTITSLNGWGSEGSVQKIAGNWYGGLTFGIRSPGLDQNDVGYNTYSDTWYLYPKWSYRSFTPGRYVRSYRTTVSLVPAWTFGGERFRSTGEYDLNIDFTNLWGFELQAVRWPKNLSPWVLRGGPAIMTEGYTELTAQLSTDRRRMVSGEVETYTNYSENRSERQFRLSPRIVIRPSAAATFSISPSAEWNRDDDQYLRTSSVNGIKHYLMGHLEQTTAALTARVSYAFTPDLALDVYAQPFLSSGHYSTIREVVSAKAKDFEQRFSTFGPDRLSFSKSTNRYSVDLEPNGVADFSFANPDFSVREMQANAVLRWQYRPGSTLYVVWSQSRENGALASGLPVRQELNRLFSVPAKNVFLVKMSYWLGR